MIYPLGDQNQTLFKSPPKQDLLNRKLSHLTIFFQIVI